MENFENELRNESESDIIETFLQRKGWKRPADSNLLKLTRCATKMKHTCNIQFKATAELNIELNIGFKERS
jgi:hypothetical protein